MIISISKKKLYCILLCAYIHVLPIMDFFTNILLLFNVRNVYKEIIQYGIFSILIILLIIIGLNDCITTTSIVKLGISILLSALLFIISAIISPQIKPILLHSYLIFLILVILTVFFVSGVEDMGFFVESIEKYYPFVILYSITILLLRRKLSHGYSMDYSYNTFIISGLAFINGIRLKSKKRICVFLLVIVTNLIAGARGVLVCDIILMILVWMWKIYDKKSKKAKIVGIVFAGSGIMIISQLMPIIAQFFYSMVQSRTLGLLASKRISILSGREIYYQSIMNEIYHSPIAVRGVLSDRVFMTRISGQSISKVGYNSYAHNIILEVLFQFGLIIGVPLLCYFVINLFRGLKRVLEFRNNNTNFAMFYILSFSYAVGQLSFSNSYLASVSFGLLVSSMLLANRVNIDGNRVNK